MTETTAEEPLSGPLPETTQEALFVRPREGRMLAGVCAGIAQRWNLDITLVRIVTVAATLVSGIGLAVYLAAWLLTPSTDGPAPIRPGGRAARTFARVPTLVLIVLAALALVAVGHALWWGAPIGLLFVVLIAAAIICTRRGRWLLVSIAALLALGIGAIGAFGAHFGTRSYHVSSVTDLHSSYDYGVGAIHLDLSGLAIDGRHRTEVRLGRGDVNVTVPSDVAVFVHARAGVGSVTVDGHKVSGIDAEQTQIVGPGTETDENRLTLDVTVGVGRVNVHTA